MPTVHNLRNIAVCGFLMVACWLPQQALAQTCEVKQPVRFAGLDYDSAAFHTAVAQTIVRLGYGCDIDRVPGATAALVNGLSRGDVDVIMEIWLANPVDAWVKASASGSVVPLGTTFPDASEGWFVPRYVVEGDKAQARGLKSVADLPKYKQVFSDPEEPAKGRFYNCPAGWVCEGINTKKLAAYGLVDHFTNVRGGSGEALVAAIESAIKRQRPVLFYYWGPSWLIGAYDLVKLEEPAFDAAIWEEMKGSDAPKRATAYPKSRVVIGANARFVEQAPQLAGFLKTYMTSSELTSRMLAAARDKGITPEEQAKMFLREQADIWRKWVPVDVAARVQAGL